MKALTIQQPYAGLIASGEKWIENRTWGTTYRGRIAIHAAKGSRFLKPSQLREFTTGAVVAVADLVAVVSIEDAYKNKSLLDSPNESCLASWREIYSHKYTEGPVLWVLQNVYRLKNPIPAKGALSFWHFDEGRLSDG